MSDSDHSWSSVTWEGAARENLVAGARLSMRDKLAWLQEMGRIARRLRESDSGRGPQRRPSHATPDAEAGTD